ncbi:MAG TPA: hypothetical protein IAB49_01905 [Candidatus Caccenecus avistercoris]|nr:hypothetical protein [Candidatus Caccenecus avistercoris]
MKKKEILIISVVIIILLLIIFGIIIFTKDTVPKANEEEQITEQEQRFISCLENELGARISSNILEFSDIKLNDIIDKTEGIMYFKGVQSGNNSYIIVKTNTTYDYDINKYFDLYFSNKYDTFQLFDLTTGIYAYLHNNENNTSKSELLKACQGSNLKDIKVEDFPSKTIDKLNKTASIVIKDGSYELGQITNTEEIEQILNYISMSKQYGENFLCDGHLFELEMLDEEGKLIDTIYLWGDGKRLLPKSLEGGCGYYSIANFDIDFRKIIEENTNYKFYGIYDYSVEGKENLTQIYEDEKYKYFINWENSDKVLIYFTLNNLYMKLEYALNNNYITPKQLEEYDGLLIRETK